MVQRPLHIAISIDELFAAVPGGGGQGRFIVNLVEELGRMDTWNIYTLFSVRPPTDSIQRLSSLPANFAIATLDRVRPEWIYAGWHLMGWPTVERYIGPQDVIHATSPAMVPASREAALLVTVHDLVWRKFPRGLNMWGRFFHRTGLNRAVKKARMWAAVSRSTASDLLDCYPGLPEEDVVTIPLGVSSGIQGETDGETSLETRRRLGVPARYILNLGTLEPRKNLAGLLRAYSGLPLSLRRNFPLVIVGAQGWKMSPLEALVREENLAEHVIWTGYVQDKDLGVLLTEATCFVYPSLYEGFGLPILEAMRCRTPVITSRISSMPEVAGEAALLVDPRDQRELTGAMSRLLQSPELRRELIAAGEIQCSRFSFQRMARSYLELYRELATKKQGGSPGRSESDVQGPDTTGQ